MTTTRNPRPRQEIMCWQCGEQFSRPIPQNVDHFKVICPYCAAECMVDFRPYTAEKSLFRQGNSSSLGNSQIQANVPYIIPSDKPPQEK